MKSTTHQFEPEMVMAYLDGELATERAAAVGAHIEQCAECAAAAAQLRGVSARMAEWQVEPAPEAMNSLIPAVGGGRNMPHAQQLLPLSEPKSRMRLFRMPQWAWGFVGVFAVLVMVAYALTGNLLRAPQFAPVQDSRSAALAIPAETQVASPPGPIAKRYFRLGDQSEGVAQSQRPNTKGRGVQARGPMVIRTASVTLETRQFDATRAAIERIVRSYGGHLGQLQTAAPLNEARTLTATLRIPAERMDAALAEIKKLGRVTREQQGSDEVTEQYTDLVARLANSRHTEHRLVEILRTRTGKVEEVLEVEREIASVREEIERMEAQRKSLDNRVALSTVSLELREEFEKKIGVAPPSTGTLLWNAMADGLDGAFESVLALALFLLRAGPSLLLWAALLFVPARSVWRRMRAATAA
jgi:hypothetical protein